MLYDFHRSENAKKPQSVNATYVITGVQKLPEKPATNGHAKDGEDDVMQSSPFMSSMPQPQEAEEEIRTTSMILAREEDLEDAKNTFQSIHSIHIYSLQPTILQDLNVLTDVGREISSNYANEDPLELGQLWGMIQNKNVKRRKGVRPPPAPAKAAAPKPAPATKPSLKKEESVPEKKEGRQEKAEPKPVAKQSTESKPTEKSTSLKRERSDIFSSFAKAKPKQKKEESSTSTPTASGPESAERNAEDVVFDDASEEEREDLFLDTGKRTATQSRESRKEREERLKKMMEEEEDEDMPDAPQEESAPEPEEPQPEDTPKEEAPEPKEEVVVQGGRRRGKRKVMKKKTIKDEEGYLGMHFSVLFSRIKLTEASFSVTVEEPVWEEFSEDEPAPPPKKKPAISSGPKSKGGPKAGQGNIMSFFSKK
ncbi:CDC27 protein [Paecilomyces lecythidis]|uniref:DNA polymerase delta subunit 3 n=1 Tax=Paecilomyces lecythidis TaxID=3004212 RepID=A0ABR3XJ43_9EURO